MTVRGVLYWALVMVLIGFGIVTGFTIGIPFLLMGATLMVVAPLRGRPTAFWPPVLAIPAFVAGFILVAPIGCTTTSTAVGQGATGRTTCTNIIGLNYSGPGGYNPSLRPGLLAGLATAIVVGSVVRIVLQRRAS